MAQPESKGANTIGVNRSDDARLLGGRLMRSFGQNQKAQQKDDKSNALDVVPSHEEAKEINTCSTQSYIRVPCKARGVRGTHIARNAYIDVPINAAHGDILLCSNKTCRSSGRVFRYCKVCDMPTAKRTFIKRHGHGLDVSNFILEDGTEEDQAPSNQEEDEHSMNQSLQGEMVSLEKTIEKKVRSSVQDHGMESSCIDIIEGNSKGKPRLLQRKESKNDASNNVDKFTVKTRLLFVSDAEAEWLALIRNKPLDMKENQASRMAWVSKIIAFIYPEFLDRTGQPGAEEIRRNQQNRSSSDDESILSEIIGTSEGALGTRYGTSPPNLDQLGLETIFDNESD